MKVLVKSAWGSDDPTKTAFSFLHGNALAENDRPANSRSRLRHMLVLDSDREDKYATFANPEIGTAHRLVR